jgi:hypothetical protein
MKCQLAVAAIAMYAIAALAQTPDSPLVAAARYGAAARRKAALEGRVIVTNDMLKSNRILSTSSGQAEVAPYVPPAMPASMPARSTASAPSTTPSAGYVSQTVSDPRLPRESNNGGMTNTMPSAVAATSVAPGSSQNPGVYRPPQ